MLTLGLNQECGTMNAKKHKKNTATLVPSLTIINIILKWPLVLLKYITFKLNKKRKERKKKLQRLNKKKEKSQLDAWLARDRHIPSDLGS